MRADNKIMAVISNNMSGKSNISNFDFYRRVFTLVELLVVMAIIAILACMLMPMLQKVMKQGRTVVCTNNLRQCAQLMSMYADDFNGSACIRTNSSYGTWSNVLIEQGYLDSKGITCCVSVELDPDITEFQQNNWVSYAMPYFDTNTYGDYFGKSSDSSVFYMKTRHLNSKAFVFLDGLRNINNIPMQMYIAQNTAIYGSVGSTVNTSTLHMRHQQHGNVAFLDAHVKGLSPAEFYYTFNDAYRSPLGYSDVNEVYYVDEYNLIQRAGL